jgi:uncharacterized caspase-like protein
MPFRCCLLALIALVAGLAAGHAEPRIALVIGNGAYREVTPLDNPVRDADLMAGTLRSVGFVVTLITDSDQDAMKRGIADFGRALRDAGPDATALFYYAGHAVQSQGINYLLPVDSVIRDEADLDLVGVEANWVLRQLFSARNRTSIVILDACRNNPFEAAAGMTAQGLAEMKAPTGSFLAYATAPGNVALDGTGGNSPFTAALAEEIRAEGQAIEQVFKQVRVRVLEATGGAQTPWDSSSLTGEFLFTPAAAMSEDELAMRQLWTSVRETGDPVQIMLFLRAYPDSRFDAEARALLGAAVAAELEPPAAAPAPAAAPDVRESALIERAQASGLLADYEAYAAAFPDGVFADLARSEIANLQARTAAAPEAPAVPEAPAETAAGGAPAPAGEEARVTYLAPLTRAAPQVLGRSIAEIAQGTPMYPPVEGLPDSYWKDKTCGNCHAWTRQALCDQGTFYTANAGSRSLSKEHPLGGAFKQVLRDWAAGGCR